MDISWDDARLFLAVAEAKSLSGAAKALRVGQPTVSRRLAELEYELGFPLFQRSHGGAALTARGERLVEPARRMAEWAAELSRSAETGDHKPRGAVRLTAPPGVAFDFVAPFAAYLASRYPELRLEVLSSVQYLDLSRGEADLALRLRAPTQRDLLTVAKLEHDNSVFVARSYAKTLPKKVGFADVKWIAWAPPLDRLPPNPELAALIPGFKPAFAADDFLVQVRAAEAGVGAMILGKVKHRFSTPTPLVPLDLPLGPHARGAMHLVCTKSALAIPRVRAVAELLGEELARVQAASNR